MAKSLQKPTPSAPAATPAAAPSLSRGLRRYLYCTAALTGAAIMVVEILGAKMLSPFVGLSHFVWTAQIAVTLVALACGYYAGGRLADRSPRLAWLYWAILGAAIYLALTVIVCEPVAYWSLDFNLAVGSLLASAILFFVPLALLAMTGPFLVRVITSSVAGVGGTVGRLTAISTLGSVAGTLVIGYLLVPRLPNSATMYMTAVVLVLVAAGYFMFFNRQSPGMLLLFLLLGSSVGLSTLAAPMRGFRVMREVFHGNSPFGQLQVLETHDGGFRYYLNDNLVQNTYDPKAKQSGSTFTYMLSGLARAYTTNIHDALCIGLGVGIVPMEFARQGVRVDVVEINPAVVRVARDYFDLDPAKIRITIDDGRHFLNRCKSKYDAVVLDAFLGDSSPSHLLTREAFSAMRRVLKPAGVLVINSFGELQPGRDYFSASLNNTLKAVFPGVRAHVSSDGAIFFVGANYPDLRFIRPPDCSAFPPLVQSQAAAAFAEIGNIPAGHGRVLTDDFNPVEFYDAHNREGLRRKLALSMREW